MNKPLIRYLPLFQHDLEDAYNYICDNLQNPQAAKELINAVEEAIIQRSNNPESFEQYNSLKDREYPYYRIYVKNFVVYYVVIPGNPPIMEIRRFLFSRRNREAIV